MVRTSSSIEDHVKTLASRELGVSVREAKALPQGEARDLLSPEKEVLAQCVDVVRATSLRVATSTIG